MDRKHSYGRPYGSYVEAFERSTNNYQNNNYVFGNIAPHLNIEVRDNDMANSLRQYSEREFNFREWNTFKEGIVRFLEDAERSPTPQTSQYIFEVLTQKCNSVITGQARGSYAEGIANILQRVTPESWRKDYNHFQTELRNFEFASKAPKVLRFFGKTLAEVDNICDSPWKLISFIANR